MICVALTLARKTSETPSSFPSFSIKNILPLRKPDAEAHVPLPLQQTLMRFHQDIKDFFWPDFTFSAFKGCARFTVNAVGTREEDRRPAQGFTLQRGAITAPTRTRLPDVDRFIDPDQRHFPLPSDKRAGSSYRLPFKRHARNRWL